MRFALRLLVIIGLFPGISNSDVPGQINFQGVLLDNTSQVINGSVDFDFAMFDAATSGTQLWTESQTGVTVTNGTYNVALGSVTTITTDVLSGSSVYLEITVGGETLSPRQRLLAVPYALETADAASVAGVPGAFIQQLYQNVSYDGLNPPNDDPREGFADTDGDGIANFLDSDNDNDGINDAIEDNNGTDINLVTPTISSFTGPWETTNSPLPRPAEPNLVSVTGTNFLTGFTVQVGPENPTPQNITSTSFDITVGTGQVEGTVPFTITTPNAEVATSSITFQLVTPSISTVTGPWASLNPPFPRSGQVNSVTVTGINFELGFTVQVGSENPTPQNATDTSFDVTVGTNQVDGTVPVIITNPNTKSATSSLTFVTGGDKLVFVTSTTQANALNQSVVTADAFCAQAATTAGLEGTYAAWYSDAISDAKDRLPPVFAGFFIRTDGQLVAMDLADLIDGSIANAISLDEYGNPVNSQVATNTLTGGTNPSNSCLTGSSSSAVGSSTGTNFQWTGVGTASCTASLPYYCFRL